MRTRTFTSEKLLDAFYQAKIMTKQHALSIAQCSPMTLWRMLKHHGYFASYNCNASFYTLADIPTFDEHGLWSYRRVRFSKFGSLYDTVIALVTTSPGGLTALELGQLMGINVLPSLTTLYQQGRLGRQKVGPVYWYCANDPQRRDAQGAAHQANHEALLKAVRLPEPAVIIAVLVELIKNPNSSVDQLYRRLAWQGLALSVHQIEEIMMVYDLREKKKPNF